jgi:hypothetical protein
VGADDVSGEQWQLVADIHVEGVGLILCEWETLLANSFLSCGFLV